MFLISSHNESTLVQIVTKWCSGLKLAIVITLKSLTDSYHSYDQLPRFWWRYSSCFKGHNSAFLCWCLFHYDNTSSWFHQYNFADLSNLEILRSLPWRSWHHLQIIVLDSILLSLQRINKDVELCRSQQRLGALQISWDRSLKLHYWVL